MRDISEVPNVLKESFFITLNAGSWKQYMKKLKPQMYFQRPILEIISPFETIS